MEKNGEPEAFFTILEKNFSNGKRQKTRPLILFNKRIVLIPTQRRLYEYFGNGQDFLPDR